MKQPNAGRKRNLAVVDNNKPDQAVHKNKLIKQNDKQEPFPIDPPSHLNKDARDLWKSLAPELIKMGLVTKSDQPNFEMFCTQYQEYREAYAAIKKHGTIYKDSNGNLRKNPAVNVLDTCTKNIRSLGMVLGIDFNSRSQLTDTKSEDNNIDIDEAMKAFGG